ncbi:MAG: anhydro-N-acetylmuramic acid kinase [Lysobacteraceae bacterium]|nr:MAG: anhydro-N-acetylmuramic acid kinase [Xanthomonadaceae bacterium]
MPAHAHASDLFLGLISGTSVDGIDAAIACFHAPEDGTSRVRAELVFGRTYPWEPGLRTQLVQLGQHDQHLTLDELGELDTRIGAAFAEAAQQAIADSGVRRRAIAAIGSHGQTLRHRPLGRLHDGIWPFTLQLGDANLIAERCGIRTVADFRRRDLAAGGHGAPLLPALHASLLSSPLEDRAVLNLGGIANLTLLPVQGVVRGFDTGPANGLMDAWCLRHTGERFDRDGRLAASGRIDAAMLARLLGEPWFALPPPKSTGRDQFHLGWIESVLHGDESPADVQATLLALTAHSVADALRATQPRTARVLVCGGGVHNAELMRALTLAIPGAHVESTARHGIDPDHVEAVGFAWLARQTLLGLPGNLPTVTGAAGPRVLGAVYSP